MIEHMKQVGSDGANGEAPEPTSKPPSYEYATGSQAPVKNKGQEPSSEAPKSGPPAPYAPPPIPSPGATPVYYYQHPITGHMISTPLPPDDPEMVCLQAGAHVRQTRFGILGILAAVFWFPLGIGLCLLDRRIVCKRCGRVIDDGISC